MHQQQPALWQCEMRVSNPVPTTDNIGQLEGKEPCRFRLLGLSKHKSKQPGDSDSPSPSVPPCFTGEGRCGCIHKHKFPPAPHRLDALVALIVSPPLSRQSNPQSIATNFSDFSAPCTRRRAGMAAVLLGLGVLCGAPLECAARLLVNDSLGSLAVRCPEPTSHNNCTKTFLVSTTCVEGRCAPPRGRRPACSMAHEEPHEGR